MMNFKKLKIRPVSCLLFIRNVILWPVVRTPWLFGFLFAILLYLPLANFIDWRYDGNGFWDFLDFISEPVAWAVTVSWFIAGLYNLLRRWKRWMAITWLSFAGIILTLNWLIDLGCYLIYCRPFTRDLAGVFLATNLEEGTSFVSSFFNFNFFLWMVGSVAAAVVTGFLLFYAVNFLRRLPNIYKLIVKGLVLCFVIWALVMALFLTNPKRLTTTNVYGKILAFRSIDKGHPIVLQHPDLILDQTDVPEKIVVVIGESHARHHSQLYGYSRETQPNLTRLAADSSLVVFANPVSPGSYTMAAIRRIIGTYDGSKKKPWYEHTTWLETSQIAGYNVAWVSNQSPKGVYDNPIFYIAQVADKYAFTTDGMEGISKRTLDEKVLPLIDKYKVDGRQVMIVHLMGNHLSYKLSYPVEESYFFPANYTDRPENQRSELAYYDNSVRYNDKIMKEIYDRFADDDAVVIYLSDHGQDLYDTDPNYRGHARGSVPASLALGKSIPFYIYMSPVFRERHPALAQRIREAGPRGADTDNLIYTIMDLTGARFADDPAITDERSIIRKTD